MRLDSVLQHSQDTQLPGQLITVAPRQDRRIAALVRRGVRQRVGPATCPCKRQQRPAARSNASLPGSAPPNIANGGLRNAVRMDASEASEGRVTVPCPLEPHHAPITKH